ncbi:hypothetical protein [Spirillospora sp. NPDC048824]|uniref:hypothetical protein n=1 Tax=Spirillospora sp. NPDC048824 TaxID=3364526 RepID=UPI00371A7311
MKSRRPARRSRSVLARIAGYAGTTLLVAAAIVVLLVPLLDDGKSGGTAGAQGSASPSSTSPGGPPVGQAGPGIQVTPTGPAPQQSGSDRPDPAGGGGGGGPQIPGPGGNGGLTWCPEGTAAYRATGTGVDVVITVASSGAIRAELSLRGRSPESQQTTVTGGRPHTFHFTGVSPQLVERVKVTTVSVGVSMQTCYARAAA